MSKIAAADNAAMNELYAAEMARTGSKVASEKIDAFKDHEEYEKTLDSVLADDKSESWDPNNPLLD